jgi:hypothetical protein
VALSKKVVDRGEANEEELGAHESDYTQAKQKTRIRLKAA